MDLTGWSFNLLYYPHHSLSLSVSAHFLLILYIHPSVPRPSFAYTTQIQAAPFLHSLLHRISSSPWISFTILFLSSAGLSIQHRRKGKSRVSPQLRSQTTLEVVRLYNLNLSTAYHDPHKHTATQKWNHDCREAFYSTPHDCSKGRTKQSFGTDGKHVSSPHVSQCSFSDSSTFKVKNWLLVSVLVSFRESKKIINLAVLSQDVPCKRTLYRVHL